MSSFTDGPCLVSQIRSLCDAYPTAEKVIFVPRVQLGQALSTAVARRGGDWAGLRCCIPRHYAEEVARWQILSSERRELPPAGMRFLAADLIEQLDDPSLMEGMPAASHFARTVGRSISILRENAVPPGRVQERAMAPQASQALRVIGVCYEAYRRRLDEEGLYDDADALQWAIQHVRDTPPQDISKTIYAVCDGTDLPELEYRWLKELQKQGAAFYRLGEASSDAPPHTAASLFADVPRPNTENSGGSASLRVRRAVGAENEVRGVLQEILEKDIPLDEVEIAFAANQPYLSLVADLANRIGIDLSLGTGLPALQTRSGQALHGFYEWIQEDFDVQVLIRLLRGGLLRVDRVPRKKDTPFQLTAHEVATLLAGRRYEPGREGYAKAFAVARDDLTSTIERLEERGLSTDREQGQLRILELIQDLVGELLDLAPRQCTVQEMARASQRFLERFGPIDRPPEQQEEAERTLEEAARSVLYQKLDGLARLPFSYDASCARTAGMIQEGLQGQYVQSSRPRPGAVYVIPIESAGYTGRQHLFVLGMDSETLSWPAVDDVMLRDADRMVLGADLDGQMRESQAAADEALWRIACALRRHQGTVTLSASVFDTEGSEERFPASLFLEVEAASEEAVPPRGLLPGGNDVIHLDDRTCWLGAYAAGRGSSARPERTARAALERDHPWVVAGEEARRACCSERYTCHDGLLKEGPYPELDFTDPGYDGPPMSAGRLEKLAETPYHYFLKYVLGIDPLDEPALEEVTWLNPLRRGSLLHRTFERFMSELDGEPVQPAHEEQLMEALEEALDEEKRRIAPPNERVEAAACRALREDVRVFLHAELEVADGIEPLHHEVGFGYGLRYRQDGDFDEATLTVDEEIQLSMRGRIDRVDRLEDGTLAIWDYKTGSSSSYSQDDPLKDGANLQWALYAYVLGELTDETVRRSGYLFVSSKEMGLRLDSEPEPHREAVAEMIRRLGEMARHGCFPMSPGAKDASGWKWGGYGPLFPDLAERSRQLKAKAESYPEDRPRPLFLD